MNYKELLQDPRWKAKSYEIKKKHNFTCLGCKRKNLPLHVHHSYYILELKPWEYKNGLYTLCETCHRIEHHNIKHRMTYKTMGEYKAEMRKEKKLKKKKSK
jgi:5-methylcytosine-specific restriction endonuclease McrA